MEPAQTGKYQPAQGRRRQEKHRRKNGHLDATAGKQLLVQTGIASRQGIIHPDGAQYVSFPGLVATQAVNALIVLPGNHRLNQGVNPAFLISGISLHPLAGQRFPVQGLPFLFGLIAGTIGPVQQITSNHPHIQNILGGLHLLPKYITVANGAGDHHGVQPVEIGLGQPVDIPVAELFNMGAL